MHLEYYYIYLSDHLGGSNLDTDANGEVLQITDYLPYGKERLIQQNSDYKNKYLFGGKEKDTESDLQYFEARYYNNGLGRFVSQDPVFWEVGRTKRGTEVLVDPQQLNSYSYARNSPVVLSDPSGEYIAAIIAGIIEVLKPDTTYAPGPGNVSIPATPNKTAENMGYAEIIIPGGGLKKIAENAGKNFVKAGGKIANEANTLIKRLEKGIKSLENQIGIHQKNIKDIKEGLYKIDPKIVKGDIVKYREGLIKHWEKEIQTFKNQIIEKSDKIKELQNK